MSVDLASLMGSIEFHKLTRSSASFIHLRSSGSLPLRSVLYVLSYVITFSFFQAAVFLDKARKSIIQSLHSNRPVRIFSSKLRNVTQFISAVHSKDTDRNLHICRQIFCFIGLYLDV